MSKKRIVDAIRVKEPCTESWDEMTGNEKVRFCSHCTKNVNNISLISSKEAVRLVRASKGSLCVRYFEDPVTKAPIFADQLVKLTRRAGSVAAGIMSASFALSSVGFAQGGISPAAPISDESAAAKPLKSEEAPVDEGLTQLSGTIADENGAVMSGAMVVLQRIGSAETISTMTNMDGTYYIDRVSPGDYLLKVSQTHFVENISRLKVNGQVMIFENRTLEVERIAVSGAVVITRYYSPLALAVDDDDIEAATELLARGADINTVDEGVDFVAPLFVAVQNVNLRMVKLLLDWGADPNILNSEKRTPLMEIDSETSPELVKLLIDSGAKLDLADEDGNTALIIAADDADASVVKVLVDAGANVRLKNKEGENALMKAAYDDDIEKVRILLLAGAGVDINDKDNEGETAFEMTVEDEIEDLLASYGAIRTIEVDGVDDDNEPN